MAAHANSAARMQAKQKKAHWGNCWGRFADDNQDARFIVDEHTEKKFATILGEDLQSKIVSVDAEDCVSPRMREPIITLTVAGRSPMEVILESQRPICDRTPGNPVRRELFPAEQKHASEIPLLSSAVKMIECCISLDDIQQARKTKRAKGSVAFNGLSANLLALAWGTACHKETWLELLHLIAKAGNGNVNLANMVIGSVDANTKMMAYDGSMQYLLEHGLCQYVMVRVFCTLRQKANSSKFTHHAATIQITYETDNGLKFESPIIDANLRRQPSVTEANLIKTLIIRTQLALLEKGTESCIAEMNVRVPPRADNPENINPKIPFEHPIPPDIRKDPASYPNKEDEEQADIFPRKSERLKKHAENRASNALLTKDDKALIVRAPKGQGSNPIPTKISKNPSAFYSKSVKKPSSSDKRLHPLPFSTEFG